jgi:cytochrome c-type biogenesis protein CcmE|tara:strand:+ start:417 stop:839 length:423 start_codon:yes stop_codon:yes gene_type:complete
MLPRHRRFLGICLVLLSVGLASFFILKSFQDNLLYYLTPSEVIAGKAPNDREFRIGGLVVNGSFYRETGSLTSQFVLTDGSASIEVSYKGILPDLFREGQGIIAKGKFNSTDLFLASEVLAKHDENYMPPEIHAMQTSLE